MSIAVPLLSNSLVPKVITTRRHGGKHQKIIRWEHNYTHKDFYNKKKQFHYFSTVYFK
jgi:hypothetical protein